MNANKTSMMAKKQATEVICGFKPGNRNVSRTAFTAGSSRNIKPHMAQSVKIIIPFRWQVIGMEQNSPISNRLNNPFTSAENQVSILNNLADSFDRSVLFLYVQACVFNCIPIKPVADYSRNAKVPSILIRYASRLAKNVARRPARVCGLLLL
jgi:hypothetical protein